MSKAGEKSMRILVIGAGNSGLATAAHLAYNGHSITLWNRSKTTIQRICSTKAIFCEGIINGKIPIENVTNDIKEAVHNAEIILVTTPASSHEDVAKLLAQSMTKEIPIVLNPGRTFGALNFYLTFKKWNPEINPQIAETQTILYTCRKMNEDRVVIYSLKKIVKIAALFSKDLKQIINKIPTCIRSYFDLSNSFLETSFGNVGMILHCAPFILNTGWTECETADYKYYYDGITPTIGKLIEKIDHKRLLVAEKLGCNILSTKEWMKEEYGVEGETLYACIKNNSSYKEIDAPKSLNHRYIFEDVPYGLVPLEKIGLELGIDMKEVTVVIDLANILMERDFRKSMEYISLNLLQKYVEI